jgi:hypothetical protein
MNLLNNRLALVTGAGRGIARISQRKAPRSR